MPDKGGPPDSPHEVEAIRDLIQTALNTLDHQERRVGDAKHGVYLFTTTTVNRSMSARHTKNSGLVFVVT